VLDDIQLLRRPLRLLEQLLRRPMRRAVRHDVDTNDLLEHDVLDVDLVLDEHHHRRRRRERDLSGGSTSPAKRAIVSSWRIS
jgi:hypothetical protein